ncbi:hypothetical protein ACFWAD_00800 [Rhodococcus sp. NPDC059969]|uniref:hypothetical protein n=1 Tax=Rhodococcus sp. NPDC059969 TaxID=3347018 RepID=UPI0036732FAF
MGNEVLQADVESLRVLANAARDQSAVIAGIDVSGILADAAAAMPDSASGLAAARAGDPITAGYRATSEMLTSMADAAQFSANDYEAVEVAFRNRLAAYQAAV